MSDFLVFKEKYPFLSEYFPFFDIFKSKSSILGVARWGGRPVVKRVNVSLFLRPYPYAHICSYMLSGRIFSPQAQGPDPCPRWLHPMLIVCKYMATRLSGLLLEGVDANFSNSPSSDSINFIWIAHSVIVQIILLDCWT